jgi:sporulation protein YlmC with PRC-barrel domain
MSTQETKEKLETKDTETKDTETKDTGTGSAAEAPEFFAMTDMLRYSATAKDASFALTEIFFEPELGEMRFVALDVGGWFERREVIVSARLMGTPDDTTRTWPVEITPEAVKSAPEWSDPKFLAQMPIASIPPITVGPYGGRFAGAIPSDVEAELGDPDTPGNLKVEGYERLNDWVGLPVFGTQGEVGTLIDFLFDPETGHLSHLVVDTGGFLSAQQMVVPYDLLRHLASGGTHVVIDATENLLREAPPLEHFDHVSRSWLDTLRSYYQLTPPSVPIRVRHLTV